MKINEKFIGFIKKRNRKAFELVYDEFFDVLFYTAFKIVRSKDDALDIVQDTFYKLWEKAEDLRCDNHKAFVSWLITITKNNSLNQIKKNKHLIYNDELILQTPAQEEAKMKYSEFLNLCQGVLEEDEIDIVLYRAYYGKSFREIANLVDKPLSTISSKYYESMKKVKEVLK